MRFECDGCGTLGEAAAVEPSAEGVALVCASCGHRTSLGSPAPTEAAAQTTERATAPAQEAVEPSGLAPPPRPVHLDPSRVIKKGRVEVAPGKGAVRCPKCGYRQEEHGSCFQCGLDLTRFGESDAWERSPPGKEAQAIALKERWDAICERGLESAQETEAFINLASNDQLLDLAARWLRFYAQDHFGTPAGERASRALARLVERMHVEFVSSHGPGSRDAYVQRTKAVQGVLYVVAALMCVGVIVLAMVIFKPF